MNFPLISACPHTTLSYGVSYRMESQDRRLIARANGGKGDNSALINSDDGNLNFKKGALFSEVAKVVTEMDLSFQDDYGIFLRGRGFYDFELKDDERRHRQLRHVLRRPGQVRLATSGQEGTLCALQQLPPGGQEQQVQRHRQTRPHQSGPAALRVAPGLACTGHAEGGDAPPVQAARYVFRRGQLPDPAG
ncbi:TPA: DUF1302 domain-containing protein [Pseudomonas aeruginosa]|nr:DUF1302 domain-containing protein [Pseudomonas aeruginosa]HBO6130739.1 DUF1302 domain-containing protein [Pseudomonas aeruginosa]